MSNKLAGPWFSHILIVLLEQLYALHAVQHSEDSQSISHEPVRGEQISVHILHCHFQEEQHLNQR
jgi:hypothetical protein